MSRILFWTENFLPSIGGIEVLSNHLIQGLEKRGHEFHVVTSNINRRDVTETFDTSAISIHRFPFQSVFSQHDLFKIKSIIKILIELFRDFKPNLIHVNSPNFGIFFLELLLKSEPDLSIPLIFSLHSQVQILNLSPTAKNLVPELLARFLCRATRITAVSQFIFQDAIAAVPAITPRTSLILNGLPLPDLAPTPLPFDPPRLLCIGRVVKEKGFDTAISALAQLRTHFPEVQLILAGNGPELLPLHEQITALGLTSNVELLGWVEPEQIPALINTCTAVIVPSHWEEPFGLVALQASQMARPVVASNVGGLPEVILDQVTGLLVEPNNSNNLATAISTLLKDPSMAIQMGNVGQLRAQKDFNLEQCILQYDALYRSVESEKL